MDEMAGERLRCRERFKAPRQIQECEAVAALDAMTRDDMQRLLADVWRETRKTVIYVTHNVAEAVYLADRVVVMTPHPGTVKSGVKIDAAAPARPAQRRIRRMPEGAAALPRP